MVPSWIRWNLCTLCFLALGCSPEEVSEPNAQGESDTPSKDNDSKQESTDLPSPEQEQGEADDEKAKSKKPESKKNKKDENKDNEDHPSDRPYKLPEVTGTCPSFKNGTRTFSPAKLKAPRQVRVWVDPTAKDKKGPLVFYWHGTTSSPEEALTGLGPAIAKITAMGGVVAAPIHNPEAGTFPWFLVEKPRNGRLDDLHLADEILACAMKDVGIDTTRIHTLGLSAGALQSTQMSYRRSNYIASSVLYSGGLIVDAPKSAQPSNRFSSMIFHGGPQDIVVVKFKETSERYLKALREDKHFGFICDHGAGHIIPRDGVGPAWTFLSDHPFGLKSPYISGLPSNFPSYCALPK